MSIRKSDDRSGETDSRYNRTKDAAKAAEITERFDATTDNDNKFDSTIQYINEKVDECIDALNTNTAKTGITTSQASAISANTAKTGITPTQAGHITANNAKVGTETDLSVTEALTVLATVTVDRGVHTLTFTMRTADGRTTKSASLTLSS